VKLEPVVLAMIKHHEGTRYKPYRCPALLWTIGVGHVLYPEQGKLPMEQRKTYPLKGQDDRTYSKEEVDQILAQDLRRFVVGVERYCPSGLSPNRLGALVSFAFNVGLGTLQRSTLRQLHNRGDYQGAADELLKFSKAGGKVLPGLLKRRNDERALYLKGGES
jgi:GH24 family phage-related lysozyme (muramidase)